MRRRRSLLAITLDGALWLVVHTLCRIEARGVARIPLTGPGILVSNHTTNFEAPIFWVLLRSRYKSGLAKRELWHNPLTRVLVNAWGLIPLSRGGYDGVALERARRALDEGAFLGLAPEGTRSPDGVMQAGKPGVALLAVDVRAPIYPMAQWGTTEIAANVRALRRTTVHIRMGRPFRLRPLPSTGRRSPYLRQMTDEIMYQIARLLPPEYRGVYGDLSQATEEFIEWIEEEERNGHSR